MEGIAKWLADISWPIVSRVLASIGLGTVTFTGVSAAFDSALVASQNAFQGMLPVVIQLVARCGWFDFMAITSGGIASGLSFLVLKHFALKTGS